MNTLPKPFFFSTALAFIVFSLIVSTQSVSSQIISNEEALKNIQLHVIFDSHLYYNFEFSNETDVNGNQVVSKKDHKSIESNLIATLNEKTTFSFGKEKEDVSFTISKTKDNNYLFDFDITYIVDGKKANFTPSILVKKNEPSSIEIKGINSRFELNITVVK